MKQNDFQRAFGSAPEEFVNRVEDTLNRLEEKTVRGRYKFTTLVAAALIAVLLAGAAFAASQLKLFDYLNGSTPIVPLSDAESLIRTDLGFAENEFVRVAVEEGVYDGYGVLLKVRISPVSPEKRIEDMMSLALGLAEEEENVLLVSAPDVVFAAEDGSSARRESAYNEKGEVVSDMTSLRFEQAEDGSIVYWLSGNEMPVNFDVLPLKLSLDVLADPDSGKTDALRMEFALNRSGEVRRAQLIFADDTPFRNLTLVGAEAAYTDVRGYLTLEYIYQPDYTQPTEVMFDVYDGDGNVVSRGGGWASADEAGRRVERFEIQSAEEIPEKLVLEILDGETLAPICRVPMKSAPIG